MYFPLFYLEDNKACCGVHGLQLLLLPFRQMVKKEEKYAFHDQIIEETVNRAVEGSLLPDDRRKFIKVLTREMKEAAKILDFEKAAFLRDQIQTIQSTI